MPPIALYLASGESLYPGALLLLVLIALSPRLTNRWLLRLRNLAAWIALAMMLLACAPFSTAAYLLFVLLFLGWFIAVNRSPRKPEPLSMRRFRHAVGLLLAAAAVLAPALEFPHRALPRLAARPSRLAIIGDSISAGIDPHQLPWPTVFEQQTGIPTRNLAQPGATTADALDQARHLNAADTCVLVEIGGNDLLANTSAAEFGAALSQLLSMIDSPPGKRTIVMFELPLLPHRISYGRIQRRLAAEHHLTLIPKRFFISVISSGDATSDGLHLSLTGAARMSALLQSLLPAAPPSQAQASPTSPDPHPAALKKGEANVDRPPIPPSRIALHPWFAEGA